jgi:hypothetical protein
VAESCKEGYGSKRAVLPMMVVMMIWETDFENCYQTNNYPLHYRVNIFVIHDF